VKRYTLEAHGWSLEVLPDLGGSIARLRRGGRDILRRAPDDVADVLATGCFPLVPYANRIASGAFAFAGRTGRLAPNLGNQPHSLHGLGWRSTWQLCERTDASISLVHRHRSGSGWPWPYRASQYIRLEPGVASHELSLRNTGDEPMPAGLGLHPYFAIDRSTCLQFVSARVWLTDADVLPTVPAEPAHFGNWAAGAPAAGPTLVDNAYGGWTGSAELRHTGAAVHLAAEGADILHVYRPPGGGFICLEPVTHLPDAINREGMEVLGPGETRSIVLRISVLAT
jgi:aldose 1-epimerase